MRSYPRLLATAWGLSLAMGATAAFAAERTVDEHREADPHAQVEIVNVSGHVEIEGWDKAEVEVSGTLGANIERLDISSNGGHTGIRVLPMESGSRHWSLHGDPNDANLLVHVPRGSSLSASLVSADISVRDLQGDQELQTVSGDVTAAVAASARVHTVNGDVHLTAGPESSVLEVSTVSGDVEVTGGHGEISITTVSGDAGLSLGMISHAHLKTVSGDFKLKADLAADGRLEAESVSGDIGIEFSNAVPPAAFDLQAFSGDLKTCFGRKAERERYGPGSRLSFREGAGTANVHIDTNSGDVSLCARQAPPG